MSRVRPLDPADAASALTPEPKVSGNCGSLHRSWGSRTFLHPSEVPGALCASGLFVSRPGAVAIHAWQQTTPDVAAASSPDFNRSTRP